MYKKLKYLQSINSVNFPIDLKDQSSQKIFAINFYNAFIYITLSLQVMWYNLYGLFAFTGLILIGFAVWQYQQTKELLQDGVKTTATVVELLESTDSDGDVTYKPVFSFQDRNYNERTYISLVSSRPPVYQINQKVKLVYDPNDDTEIKIIGFWGLYRATIILSCIAAPLLIIGGGYFLYLRDSL